MPAPDIALPAGARLLHVGPHKTGTTALQAALQSGREELGRLGVRVPQRGNGFEEARGAITADRSDPARAKWRRLVKRVERAGEDRVVVSSEFLSDADTEDAARIVDELGGDRVHVVITLRPLVKLLASSWSQLARHQHNPPYEQWLHLTLDGDGSKSPNPLFWHRQRHGRLIERWVQATGPERLSVVIVDESDKDLLRHAFEDMLGLTRGTLRFQSTNANRSFTAGEAEFIRRCWQAIESAGIPDGIAKKYFKDAAVPYMKIARRPERDEPRITTPKWAQERAAELSVDAVERIRRSGVRVVGDLDVLRGPEPVDAEIQEAAVAPAAAALAVVKVLQLASDAEQAREAVAPAKKQQVRAPKPASKPAARADPVRAPKPRPAAPTVDQVRTAELLRIVGRRLTGRRTG